MRRRDVGDGKNFLVDVLACKSDDANLKLMIHCKRSLLHIYNQNQIFAWKKTLVTKRLMSDKILGLGGNLQTRKEEEKKTARDISLGVS